MKTIVVLVVLFCSIFLLKNVEARGKTYEDVDQILRDDTGYKIQSRTSKAKGSDDDKPIDRSKIIKKSHLMQDKYITSSSVIPLIA